MSSNWEPDYDCPQYVDFARLSIEDDGADNWFDISHDVEPCKEKCEAPVPEGKIIRKPRRSCWEINKENKILGGLSLAVQVKGNLSKPKRVSIGNKLASKQIRATVSKNFRRSTQLDCLIKKNNDTKLEKVSANTSDSKKSLRESKESLNKQQTKPESHQAPVRPVQEQVKDFPTLLRQNSMRKTNEDHYLTQPKPFNLSKPSQKSEMVTVPYRSLAEQVAAFHKVTPKRYHTRRRKSTNSPSLPKTYQFKRPTIPITPNLQARNRSRPRPASAVSQAEKERLEWEEHQKQQFKAHPIDERILKETVGVKKVESKEPTKPIPFNLTNAVKAKSASIENVSSVIEFHARPVPAGLFEGPKGLAPFKKLPVTVPETPLAAKTKLRRRSRSLGSLSLPTITKEPTPTMVKPKIRRCPSFRNSNSGIPNEVKIEKKKTIIEPFSFDKNDKERWTKKEEKIKKIVEEEKKMHLFYANPMPDLTTVKVPDKQPRPPTDVQPFNFAKDTSSRMEKWKREVGPRNLSVNMEEEIKKQKEMATFKARPNKVIYNPPFIPEKSNKPMTVVSDFVLNTEQRVVEREEFEEKVKEKELRLQLLKQQREKEIENEEEERLKVLRRAATYKANPIRHYKPVDIKAGLLPLTDPNSPNFTKRREK